MPSAGAIRAGRAEVEISASTTALTNALKRSADKLRAFGDSAKQIGAEFLRLGAITATPFVLATKTFAGFEQSMARVKALTGANGEEFDRLSQKAQRLGATTVFTASQAAEAMGFFALAGFKVDKILTAMGPTLNLAAAGQLGVAEAADIVAKIMAGMGIEAKDLGTALDVMTAAMTTANTDLRQLGDAMKFIGPIAKNAGLSLEETVAAVQLLSNAGIQGEMAGTTMRGVILSLVNPSKEAADTMRSLGVATKDTAGNVLPLVEIVSQFERSLAGLGSSDRLASLGKIFDARQVSGFAELVSQGSERLRSFTDNLRRSGGTAERVATTQLDTLIGSTKILVSALQGAGIAIGESLVGPLRSLAGSLTSATNAIGEFIKAHKAVTAIAASSAVAVLAFGAASLTVGVSVKALSFALGGLSKAMVALRTATFFTTTLLRGGFGAEIGILLARLISMKSILVDIAKLAPLVGLILGMELTENSKMSTRRQRELAEARAGIEKIVRGDNAEQPGAGPSTQRVVTPEELHAQDQYRALVESARKLHELRLGTIEDEYARAVALINAKYDAEIADARAAGALRETLMNMEAARRVELAQATANRERDIERAKFDDVRRVAEDTARIQQELADVAARTADQKLTNAELELRLKYKGLELEKKLLELEEQRRLANLQPGEDVNLIEREFSLRRQRAEQQDQERQLMEAANRARVNPFGSAGSFTSRASQLLVSRRDNVVEAIEALRRDVNRHGNRIVGN